MASITASTSLSYHPSSTGFSKSSGFGSIPHPYSSRERKNLDSAKIHKMQKKDSTEEGLLGQETPNSLVLSCQYGTTDSVSPAHTDQVRYVTLAEVG
jgi:hypothetical protein